ncbi:MAG TPA: hypothetical protein VLH13_03510, partial [Methanomassiliicoccales archaeon]|nr:hypothetical protein [Methanomassiliicoccales archaeon]
MTGFLLYVIALRFNVTEMMPVSMSRLFDCMDEGCIMIGSARRVAVINDACTAILPRADRSILGKYSETVFIIYPELVWAMDAPLVPRKDIELPTGQFLEVTVKEVQVTRWARRIMIKDLTERRRMDEDLRRANAPLQMMSRLAKHDIINIVAAIHCFASLIELRADDDKMAHTAQRTRQAAENVQRI